MKFSLARTKFPSVGSVALAICAAVLLVLAFPNFDLWFLAWFALVPLFLAVEREKDSIIKSAIIGWIFGTIFFSGACWWLTFSFETYGGIPAWLAYILLLAITGIVGIFPAMFAAAFSFVLKRCGVYGILAAPFLWTAQEFLRASLADTSWDAIAYSQAFFSQILPVASIGGVYLLGFLIAVFNSFLTLFVLANRTKSKFSYIIAAYTVFTILLSTIAMTSTNSRSLPFNPTADSINVVVVQANVPMSGLNGQKWLSLRQKHVELAENALQQLEGQRTNDTKKTLVIFPESPMNFSYGEDAELRRYFGDFARRNNISLLFNSAEPNPNGDNYFNSAVMINEQGAKIGQYDKIHLVPFGEFAPVPSPIKPLIPTLVGSFQPGENYNLFPVGDAQAGIMICYESHFPSLSRELTKRGADVIIEMTNDGYLGDTGVLRQHLAGAIFRAVETDRPVIRATNVGITAYVNERGEVSDAADVYTEATRVWTISKSDGAQTFYVRYGDWFAWLCLIVSVGLLIFSFWNRRKLTANLRG